MGYPDGMTAADWAYLDGGPQCQECGAEQNQDDIRIGICWNCEESSGHREDDGPDPDAINDKRREQEEEDKFFHVNQGLES